MRKFNSYRYNRIWRYIKYIIHNLLYNKYMNKLLTKFIIYSIFLNINCGKINKEKDIVYSSINTDDVKELKNIIYNLQKKISEKNIQIKKLNILVMKKEKKKSLIIKKPKSVSKKKIIEESCSEKESSLSGFIVSESDYENGSSEYIPEKLESFNNIEEENNIEKKDKNNIKLHQKGLIELIINNVNNNVNYKTKKNMSQLLVKKEKQQQDKNLTEIYEKFIELVKKEKKNITEIEYSEHKCLLNELKNKFQKLDLVNINPEILNKNIDNLQINDLKEVLIK